MKLGLLLSLSLLVFASCSKEESRLELFSPEVFTFDTEEGWEINASVQVKGFSFSNKENEEKFSLNYYVNLVDPSGNKIEKIEDGLFSESVEEKIDDIGINIQFELDSTFTDGKYLLEFVVEDEFTSGKAQIEKEFEL